MGAGVIAAAGRRIPRRRAVLVIAAVAAVLLVLLVAGYVVLAVLTRAPGPPRLSAGPPRVVPPLWPEGLWAGGSGRLRILGGWIIRGELGSLRLSEPVDVTSLAASRSVTQNAAATLARKRVSVRLQLEKRGRTLVVTSWPNGQKATVILHKETQ